MNKSSPKWDYIIKDGTCFDGSGDLPRVLDIAVKDGRVVQMDENLPAENAKEIIDAAAQWVMPGLVDVHTHYDLELEVSPGLPESVRHGTTTVVMSNCSLGLAFGAQRKDGDDPIISCFARVENMPKHVLKKCADKVFWNDSKEYLDHLETRPKGPNVVPMIPHSMLRIEVMGLTESVSRHPTTDELDEMKRLLKKGMDEGYAGFSTDALPFHFLANDPNRRKQIPTQFAKYSEVKALTHVVRDYDRVWQGTPPKDSKIGTLKTFMLTSGRFHGKPLKSTVVAALDVYANKTLVKLGTLLAKILNSRFIKGDFHLQALAAPFKIWSDGLYSPLAEEIDEMREIIEIDMEDKSARLALLNDPDFVARFKTMWMKGKTGFGPARLKRKLRREDYALRRDLTEMDIEACPVSEWEGQSFADIFSQLGAGTLAGNSGSRFADYQDSFDGVADEGDFVIAMLKAFDNDLVWSTVSANRDPVMTKKLLMNPVLLPGFNDSGAHLTNMAFYDCNLRALKIASEDGDKGVAYMVKRLTRDVSDLFGLDVGRLEIGAPADLVVINAETLKTYDGEAGVKRIMRAEFDHEQLVNRSDGVVSYVMINGHPAWTGEDYVKGYGETPMGRLLRPANDTSVALAAE